MHDLQPFVTDVDFGEGPRWHDGSFWYSDFYQGCVYRVNEAGERVAVAEVAERPSGLGWLPDGQMLIVSMTNRKVLRLGGDGLVEHADLSGVATWYCNDMVVAANGNAYVGNFGFDLDKGGLDAFTGAALALVRPDGTVETAATDLAFPNGSVITPDGSTLIVGETFGAQYTAFTIAADGTLSDRRIWASVPDTAPDGCVLDADGGIWFSDARGNRVLRVLEGGEVTDTIDTPLPTYACTLGGPDGRTLYILTAASASPDEARGSGAGVIYTTTVDAAHAGRP